MAILFALVLPVSAATEKRISEPAQPVRIVRERTVTLDVKDAEARDILKSMQKQCGIRNLVLDKDVQGKGTFYFESVPCRTAFPLVLRSLGFNAVNYPNSVVTVDSRPR
jgi:hypothetical protein